MINKEKLHNNSDLEDLFNRNLFYLTWGSYWTFRFCFRWDNLFANKLHANAFELKNHGTKGKRHQNLGHIETEIN